MNLTKEQILGLAPDQFTLRAGQGTAAGQKWLALHQDGGVIWGTFPSGREKTGETAVYLPNISFACSCTSRKLPCRHALGLLLLWQQQSRLFTPLPPHRQLAFWADRQKNRHLRSARPTSSLNVDQKFAGNLALLKRGLIELELWLTDLVQQGLAVLPERPKAYWEAMAHRLIDAQAPALAKELRGLAKGPSADSGWPEEYLKRLGRLYLIIQGFHHYEQLSPATQADLQTAVGWLPLPGGSGPLVEDDWLVLGRQQEVSGSQVHAFTWLWGKSSQKIAQLVDRYSLAKPMGQSLPTNTVWRGRLRFAPGSWPQMAGVEGSLYQHQLAFEPDAFNTIHQGINAYSQTLAINPWLSHFPLLLHQVKPDQSGEGWQLVDTSGTCLPLPDKFAYGWHLLALAGGLPSLNLFGIWNDRIFLPLSAKIDGDWQDLHTWRGVR